MTQTLRILIVEDSEDDMVLVLRELRRSGYSPVYERVDTPDAMREALAGREWDVIVSDYSLPQFSGLEALKLVHEKNLDIPFILVSGTVGEDLAVAAMRAGAQDYLMKGNLVRLQPSIERELREAEVRKARRVAESALYRLNEDLENKVEERTAQLTSANERLRQEIEERRRIETALRKSEESFRFLAENSTDLIARLSWKGEFIYASPASKTILGYEPEELYGRSAYELLHPDDIELTSLIHLKVLDAPTTQMITVRVRRKDGSYIWIESTVRTLRDPETGTITEMHSATRDVTERKQAEEELHARVRQQASIAALSQIALSEPDLTELMQAMVAFIAQTLEVEQSLILELKPDGVRCLLKAGYGWDEGVIGQEVLLPGKDSFFKYTLGSHKPVVVEDWSQEHPFKLLPIFNDHHFGSSIGTVIRGQKQPYGVLAIHCHQPRQFSQDEIHFFQTAATILAIAIERKRIEADLYSSEERFRQLAENIQQVFWMTAADQTQLVYVSPAYAQIWGRSVESLYQKPRSFLDAIHPDDRSRVIAAQEKQLSGEYLEEYRVVQPDGSILWVQDRAFPVRDETGKVYRIAGIASDITDMKRAQEEVRNALFKEKELNELKSRFVSMTSHEFRTPLTSILVSAEFLEHYSERIDAEKKLKHLQRIQIAVKNMTQLLNDVLVIGKAEAGKLEFSPAPLEVFKFCEELIEELQLNTTVRHSIEFVCPNDCKGQAWLVDEKLLRQILDNLLSNAIKYSPDGGVICFEMACQSPGLSFRVKDQGVGIPQEDQPRLFEIFHRAGNVGTIPGTGLGLAIVKKCVEMHGGSINLTSQEGVGTVFTVTIPAARVETQE